MKFVDYFFAFIWMINPSGLLLQLLSLVSIRVRIIFFQKLLTFYWFLSFFLRDYSLDP